MNDEGIHLWYQHFGTGPSRLVYVPRGAQTIGYMWELPEYKRFLDRLGEMAEVLTLDLRGSGLSARFLPTDASMALEARVSDIRSVMADVDWSSASFLGVEDGGALCALLTATHPELADRLILDGTDAVGVADDHYPLGQSAEEWDEFLAFVEHGDWTWESILGQLQTLAPSHMKDEEFVRRLAYLYVNSTNIDIWRVQRDLDIRAVLPSIQTPTLVLDRRDNVISEPANGAYVAERIPGARHVVLPGEDFEVFAGDQDALLDEIEEFLTGARHAPDLDRVLATVLFTDIVGSTVRAAELGDAGWKKLLGHHHERVRAELARYGGVEVDTAGDGFFATFDGPARAVRCAQSIADSVKRLGIEIRAGVHTGEVQTIQGKAGGIAVNLGARIAGKAGPTEVWASSTVKDLTAGSGLVFEDAGEHELKGVPDRWRLYRVVG